jgi:hypothetical protein
MGDIVKNMLVTVVGSPAWGKVVKMPPSFHPFSDIICIFVNLVKGGAIEDIPLVGQYITYIREFLIMIIIAFVVLLKVIQYFGPKIWHYLEDKKNRMLIAHPRPTPPEGSVPEEEEEDGWDVANDVLTTFIPGLGWAEDAVEFVGEAISAGEGWSYFLQWIQWAPTGLVCWCITTFLQIPIDILSWDMESLSLDFDHPWNSKANFFRGGCERFINGSYAGDNSLFEGEPIDTYLQDSLMGPLLSNLPFGSGTSSGYLCTHGNYCQEQADVFGKTMLGMNDSLNEDPAPTNGYLNGINISSAPRKYTACCGQVILPDCDSICHEDNPIDLDNIKDPISLLPSLYDLVQHPIDAIHAIEELANVADHLPSADRYNILCLIRNPIYKKWKKWSVASYGILPDPDNNNFFNPMEDTYCKDILNLDGRDASSRPRAWDQIEDHIKETYDNIFQACKDKCNADADVKLSALGCNQENMGHAKRSEARNRRDALFQHIIKDTTDARTIKRTPWKIKYAEPPPNPNDAYNSALQDSYIDTLTLDDGTDCSRHDLTEVELDNCFGSFRPMTAEQYPILFKNIVKDFLGTILWTCFIIFILLLVLWFLCLFNEVGRDILLEGSGKGKMSEMLKSFADAGSLLDKA